MSNQLTGVILTMFCINVMLLAAGYDVGTEILGKFVTISGNQTGLSEDATSGVPTTLTANTVEGTSGSFFGNLFDPIKVPFKMMGIIISMLLAPVNIANALSLPLFINLLVFGPITIVYYLAIMFLLRGGGSS